MRTYRARNGTTLMEMLVSLVVSTMLVAILVAVHIASIKLWRTVNVNEETTPLGNMIVDRISHDLSLSESLITNPAQTLVINTPSTTPNQPVTDIYCAMPTVVSSNNGIYYFNPNTGAACPVAYYAHYQLKLTPGSTTLYTLWYNETSATSYQTPVSVAPHYITTAQIIAKNVTAMTCWILDPTETDAAHSNLKYLTLPNVTTNAQIPMVQLSVTLQSTETSANYQSATYTFYGNVLLRNNPNWPPKSF
jgi:hypothetical protein